jgi:hypothetical protein
LTWKFTVQAKQETTTFVFIESSALRADLTDIVFKKMKKKGLTLRFKPYELRLNHAFTLAASSRTTTPVMLTEIEYDGEIGYGEASMPPYLGESQQTAARFLSQLKLDQFNPAQLEDLLDYVDGVAPGNCAAKASVDIALHDLLGKMMGQPWYRIWGYDPALMPDTSFTIGLDTEAVVRQKVKEAATYKILKVKLGRNNDKEMIKTIRSVTDVPLCVDVNQGWTDKQQAAKGSRRAVCGTAHAQNSCRRYGLAYSAQPPAHRGRRSPATPRRCKKSAWRIFRHQHQTDEMHRHARSPRNAHPGQSPKPNSDDGLHDRNLLRNFGCGATFTGSRLGRPGRKPANRQRPL